MVNLAAGEQVRWLGRWQTVDLTLPGVDFWVFDNEIAVFNHFTGDGDWADPDMETRTEPTIVGLCVTPFEAVWDRAIPHESYHLT